MVFAQLAASLRARDTTVSAHLQELYQRWVFFITVVTTSLSWTKIWIFRGPYALVGRRGYHLMGSEKTSNSYFVCTDPLVIEDIFRRIRSSGDMVLFSVIRMTRNKHYHWQGSHQGRSYPSSIGGLRIRSVVDLTEGHGYDSTNAPTYQPKLPLSLGHMIQFRASSDSDDSRIVLTIRWDQATVIATICHVHFLHRTSGTEPKVNALGCFYVVMRLSFPVSRSNTTSRAVGATAKLSTAYLAV
jgi:hypothetical protein